MGAETVTYNTICWEGDWEMLLVDGVLEQNIRYNDYLFTKKILWINNVTDYTRVIDAAQKLVDEGVLTHVYKIDDHIADAMNHFKLTREINSTNHRWNSFNELGHGYLYSVGSLCGIYTCTTDWFLNYTGDAILVEKAPDWIPDTIAYMNKEYSYKVGNLLWSQWGRYRNRRHEKHHRKNGWVKLGQEDLDRTSEYQDDNWAVGYGFSDQCFLAEREMLMEIDYNTRNDLADRRFNRHRTARGRGEAEAGFEKRVEAWKLNKGYKRVTYKNGYYVHDPPRESLIISEKSACGI